LLESSHVASVSEVNSVSDATHVTGVSHLLESSHVASVSEVNSVSDATHVTSVSHLLEAAHVAGVSEVHSVADATEVAGVSSLTKSSHVTGVSEVSNVADATHVAGVSHLSEVSEVATVADVGHISKTTKIFSVTSLVGTTSVVAGDGSLTENAAIAVGFGSLTALRLQPGVGTRSGNITGDVTGAGSVALNGTVLTRKRLAGLWCSVATGGTAVTCLTTEGLATGENIVLGGAREDVHLVGTSRSGKNFALDGATISVWVAISLGASVFVTIERSVTTGAFVFVRAVRSSCENCSAHESSGESEFHIFLK
ncbi:MAG: hypothetical protein GY849_24645, partial [Deltaproteobacteria bacterium]|nr:hypothetical protein [Deltaproteobacteria bacterium]